jgi:hypothetical protein
VILALREQMDRDEPVTTDNDDRVFESINSKEIMEGLKRGERPDVFLFDEHKKIGDFDLAEEMALLEKGEWSIARLNRSKEERDAIHAKTLEVLNKQ